MVAAWTSWVLVTFENGKNNCWISRSGGGTLINNRIDNLAEILEQLQRNGVEILMGPESDDNGTFAWIHPDGNKVELWELK